MGLLDSFFGGQESEDPRLMEAFPGQMDILKNLGLAGEKKGLEAIGMAGQPFGGPLIAPLSTHQQAGLGGIGDVLSRPLATQSPLFQQGQQAISGALEGFDPFKDLRFQALQTNLARELKRAKDRIAARTSAGQEFFGGGRLSQERELEESAFGDISNLAGYLEGESRRNQLMAAPLAQQFATLAGEEPRSRLMDALFGIGAAPRGFQQEQITAEQADRQRRLQELANIGLGTGLQASMYKPDFYVPSFGPSMFSELAGGMGQMGGLNEIMGGLGTLGTQLSGLLAGVPFGSIGSITGSTPSGGFTFGG